MLVMLFEVFQDVPGTVQSGRKIYQITAFDLDSFAFGRGDDGSATQDIAGFGYRIAPWEPGYFFFPDGPVIDAQYFKFGGGGFVFTQDWKHV
jgi:hypothetical protein